MKTSQREENREGPHMTDKRVSKFKKMRARICHHCPVCSHTRRNPERDRFQESKSAKGLESTVAL
jgi:hypothetical protein